MVSDSMKKMTRISPQEIKKREERKKLQEAQAEQDALDEAQRYAQMATKAQQLWNTSKPCVES